MVQLAGARQPAAAQRAEGELQEDLVRQAGQALAPADGAVVLNLRRGARTALARGRAANPGGQHYYSHLSLRPPSKDFNYNQPLIREAYILLRGGLTGVVQLAGARQTAAAQRALAVLRGQEDFIRNTFWFPVSSATQARVPKQNCWSAFTGWGTTSTRAKVALGWRGASWAKLSLLSFDPKEGQTCGSSFTSPP